ncbi:hypothetical protein H5410_013268 [Solanum commersonii]|uniref:Uncharacterized protein n=1 Tax=Solanum commersonii TaxID=4109 RepID=A0A9J6AUY5_SOLCO|nr:hypothetical protein H5410_013268 [Solanum commersonii]
MDDIEEVFMKWNYIDKKPYDICHMIEEAILVAGIKYPHQFHKRKNRMISNPSTFDDDDGDDDTSTLEEEDSVVRDEDELTNAEEETQQRQKQITKPLKIRITYSKTVQVAPMENHNNCNANYSRDGINNKKAVHQWFNQDHASVIEDDDTSSVEEEYSVVRDEDELLLWKTTTITMQITQELKKTPEMHDLDEETQRQSHNTTTMGSTKGMSTKHVQVAPPRVKLLSDFSFEKELDGHKQLKKQSQKGFKKMETDRIQQKRIDSDTEKKTPTQRRMGSTARKQCTSGLTKTMPASLKKMNVAIERVQSPPRQHSNCSAITRPIQSSALMQKETQSINEIKKFESSKRKFEERLAEQKTTKRRIIMVDHHDMPKLPNDPHATRRC